MNVFLLLSLVLILIILIIITTIVIMKNNEPRYRPVNLSQYQLGEGSDGDCIKDERYSKCNDYKYSYTHHDSCARGNTPCGKTFPYSGKACTWDTDKGICKKPDVRCQDKSAIKNRVERCDVPRSSDCMCEPGKTKSTVKDKFNTMCNVCE